jgi:hypothetical protein
MWLQNVVVWMLTPDPFSHSNMTRPSVFMQAGVRLATWTYVSSILKRHGNLSPVYWSNMSHRQPKGGGGYEAAVDCIWNVTAIRAETRFRLSAKQTSPFKSAGASVQSTTGSPAVRISCSNARHTMFRGSMKSTGYPLHSPVSPSLLLPCVNVCHHISTGLYHARV